MFTVLLWTQNEAVVPLQNPKLQIVEGEEKADWSSRLYPQSTSGVSDYCRHISILVLACSSKHHCFWAQPHKAIRIAVDS